ncbi:MAG: LCP family protein [Chloroflexi bacterium]|nr:LCP family protein [Chloroflexota bacterium]
MFFNITTASALLEITWIVFVWVAKSTHVIPLPSLTLAAFVHPFGASAAAPNPPGLSTGNLYADAAPPPPVERRPVAPVSLFGELITPVRQEAQRRREERLKHDPASAARVDPRLNQNRINFLLFGYGETYEPPFGPDFKGSINIFSLDPLAMSVDSITLNHDIRAPEIERYRQTTDRILGPSKIQHAYAVGGFALMREVVEDATGLAVDFQMVVHDGVIKRAVDELLGGLNLDVPFDFDAMPIYW